jgi:hypothetical protein
MKTLRWIESALATLAPNATAKKNWFRVKGVEVGLM